MELKSLYIEFLFVLIYLAFGNFSRVQLFSLMTISMNLFDQIVIVICDLVIEG